MKLEYLIFNLIIVTAPFLARVFVKKGRLPPMRLLFYTACISSIPFLILDQIVINWFWGFNSQYVLGIHIGKIPVEEVLFFFTVPITCLIFWHNFTGVSHKLSVSKVMFRKYSTAISSVLLFSSIILYVEGFPYMATVFIFAALTILLDVYLQTRVLLDMQTWRLFAVVLILTTIFNGYLTARPVVQYDTTILTKLFVFTIPVEDYLYGLVLILLNLIVYNKATALSLMRKNS